jgi:thymidylate synthase (FAD)
MKAELLDYFGNDLMVVNAARVSYGKEKQEFGLTDVKLLKYLIQHKHTSPFRHPQLQFRITCPVYVERQLFKHQVGLTANCLHGDSVIRFINSSGGINDVSIKDLYEQWTNGRPHQNTKKDMGYVRRRISNMKLRVLNEQSGEFTFGSVKNVFKSGTKKIYAIRLESGDMIKCSPDHRIWTQDGWKTINDGLSTGDLVGLNGTRVAGTGSYRIKSELEADRMNGLSVTQMADKHSCSYHTIRKWLKIHDLSFSKNERSFSKNHTPWNKGNSGYTLNISDEGMRVKQEIQEQSALDRYSVMTGSDITVNSRTAFNLFAKRYLLRNNLIYDKDANCSDLEVHHIIPQRVDPDRFFNIDNVILISKNRHLEIHSSWQNELKFASEFYDKDILDSLDFRRKGNVLKVHFSKIVDISYLGEDETYDIEVEGPHHNFVANGIVVHNSISGRYVDFSDSYTMPNQLRLQSKDSKQGSEGVLSEPLNQSLCNKIEDLVDQAASLYGELCKAGVAKEQARIVLPLCLNTQFIWTGSLAAFLHMWDLRIKPDAQEETRILAQQMLDEIENLEGQPFKHTLAAWRAKAEVTV